MGQVVFEILNDYKIADRIEYFILNNVSSNNTCVEYFIFQLVSNLISRFKAKARRPRYFGYILNFVAKAFLFGIDVESFEAGLGNKKNEGRDYKIYRVEEKRPR